MELFIILLVLQAIVSGILSAFVANEKNRSASGWFVVGLLFGIMGLIAVAGVPFRKVTLPYETENYEKKCPKCAEYIKKEAFICKYCHNSFSKDQVISELIEDIEADSYERRIEVSEILELIGNVSILPDLIDKLKEAHSKYEETYYIDEKENELSIISIILRLLEKFGDDSLSTELAEIIENSSKLPSEENNICIVRVLVKFHSNYAIPFLVQCIKSPDKDVVSFAMNSLVQYGDEVLPELKNVLGDANKSEKKRIELMIERIKKLSSCEKNY